MQIDPVDRTTLNVLFTVSWNLAVASFLAAMLLGGLAGGSPTIGSQMIGAVFVLSLFMTIGTSLQLWRLDRRSRRNNKAPQAQGSRSA